MSVVDGLIYVRDLGSKHGTFVNGARVREAILYPGDHLQIGLFDFVLAYKPSGVQVGASVSI
jgi:pSer/pThr/pTyr-binding forkhead associated (FHA) protein